MVNLTTRTMAASLVFLLLIVSSSAFSTQDDSSYPHLYRDNKCSCSNELIPLRTEVYGNGRIYDITHKITSETLTGHPEVVGDDYLTLYASMKNGSIHNFTLIKLPAYVGTHVDTPGHMFESYFDAGFDVDSLDLEVLNGPALLVDVPRNNSITAEVMKSLNIPKGVRRVLFRTSNTDRQVVGPATCCFKPVYLGNRCESVLGNCIQHKLGLIFLLLFNLFFLAGIRTRLYFSVTVTFF